MTKHLIKIAILCSLFMVGCERWFGGTAEVSIPKPKEIRMGAFLSLSGPQKVFAQSAKSGIELAIHEINQQGGIKGIPIRLITYDDQGSTDEVRKVINRLVQKDRVHVLIGEVESTLSLAAGEVAQALGVPMVTPLSTHPGVTEVGNFIFRVCFTDRFQGEALARFSRNRLKLKRAVIIGEAQSEYSRGLGDHFSKHYIGLSGEILGQFHYQSGGSAFEGILKQALSLEPELLFLPGYFNEVSLIMQQARKLGFQGVFLGGDGWDSEGKLFEIAGEASRGSYYSNHFSRLDRNPMAQRFVRKYEAFVGKKPNALSAMGYDSAMVIRAALQRTSGFQPLQIRDSISQTKNHAGVSGIITLNARGDAVKPAVILKIIGRNRHEYIQTVNPQDPLH